MKRAGRQIHVGLGINLSVNLVVVSGLSGSGKTTALHTLEDEGYYCIDNLPPGLLTRFAELLSTPAMASVKRAAVGIDVRSGIGDLDQFPRLLDRSRKLGIDVETIYLDAENDALIRRFSETRRRHPLTRDGLPLLEAIEMERGLLGDVATCADLHMDTTQLNIHQLRTLIRERVAGSVSGSLALLFQSFGYKAGVPRDSDYVFDVRCLPNPYWNPALRHLTGRDAQVISFLEASVQVGDMLSAISAFLDPWLKAFEAQNRRYAGISLGCTGGQHRSVYLAERLADHFREQAHYKVTIRHRELA